MLFLERVCRKLVVFGGTLVPAGIVLVTLALVSHKKIVL